VAVWESLIPLPWQFKQVYMCYLGSTLITYISQVLMFYCRRNKKDNKGGPNPVPFTVPFYSKSRRSATELNGQASCNSNTGKNYVNCW